MLNLRQAAQESILFDASRPLFRVGGSTRVSEFLQAITMIKGSPMGGAGPTTNSSIPYTLQVTVQRINGALPTAAYYDNLLPAAGLTNINSGMTTTNFIGARVGARFALPRIDAQVTAQGTAVDGVEVRTYAAAQSVLRFLDTQIIQGTGLAGGSNQIATLNGLDSLAVGTQSFTATASLETDIRNLLTLVTPSGTGAGDGPHCLVGGTLAMRRLMATATGQNGQSGWRVDRRTGLMIYHYMGIPFYRADVVQGATTTIYAVNLGGTGLNLVYGYGSTDSFGLVVESDPVVAPLATSEYMVHGAYALVAWELESVAKVTGVTNSPL